MSSFRPVLALVAVAVVATLSVRPPAAAGQTGAAEAIVFSSHVDANPDIYAVSPHAPLPTNVTRRPGARDVEPAWSPDGRRIAFARSPASGSPSHIWVMAADGHAQQRLTTGEVIDRQPSWSREGSRIVFTRSHTGAAGSSLYLVNVDGSGLARLTAPRGSAADGAPAWSPTGRRIAFSSTRAGRFPQLYSVDPVDWRVRRLRSNGRIESNPSWSPDGAWLAFERCCPDGRSRISVAPIADPGAHVDVTPTHLDAFDPTWSPDGTRISFVGQPAGGGVRNLYVVTLDRGASGAPVGGALTATRLTYGEESDSTPDWHHPPAASSGFAFSTSGPTSSAEGRLEATAEEGLTDAGVALPKRYRVRVSRVARGLRLMRIVDPRGPKRIFVLRANPAAPLSMDVALAGRRLPAFSRTSAIAGGHGAIAAVNGDFGVWPGHPTNLFAEDGDLKQTTWISWGSNFSVSMDESTAQIGAIRQSVTATDLAKGERSPVTRWNQGHAAYGQAAAYSPVGGTLFAPQPYTCAARLLPDGPPSWNGRQDAVRRDHVVGARRCSSSALPRRGGTVLNAVPGSLEAQWLLSLQRGGRVRLSWSVGRPGVLDTVGGFPMLLDGGEVVVPEPSEAYGRLFDRHPRTAVGATSGGRVLMVVVDGRRPGYSVGMKLGPLARLMRRLGAVQAMNLDGGGSSTMVVRGRVVNRPSDPGGERPISSALLVLPGADAHEPISLHAEPGLATGPAESPSSTRTPRPALAGRLAATDPASTGGLADALVRGVPGVGVRALPSGLRDALRLYRSTVEHRPSDSR